MRNNPALDGCNCSFGIVDYSKDNDSEYSQTITNEILSSMKLILSKLFLVVAEGALSKQSSNIDKLSLKKWSRKLQIPKKREN